MEHPFHPFFRRYIPPLGFDAKVVLTSKGFSKNVHAGQRYLDIPCIWNRDCTPQPGFLGRSQRCHFDDHVGIAILVFRFHRMHLPQTPARSATTRFTLFSRSLGSFRQHYCPLFHCCVLRVLLLSGLNAGRPNNDELERRYVLWDYNF